MRIWRRASCEVRKLIQPEIIVRIYFQWPLFDNRSALAHQIDSVHRSMKVWIQSLVTKPIAFRDAVR